MRSLSSCSDRGTVTAELAMGIPSVLGVAGLLLAALRWGMDGVTATSIASDTAYSITRGEPAELALNRARAALPSGTWTVNATSASTCVAARLTAPIPFVPIQTVSQCVTN
ncbi:MAG: hypothetical protein ACKOWN_07365 [Microbacteriaceae bacterium]